ncbi:hypothetical protein FHR87_000727 [Azomonas macrocytogenes]|uniref:Uncharacterized protein n=1 Tax=Azomonas macrocytogenes TaxID=69962 RepID=A0A839T1T5_AZOMA|nr:hypothetical protein [Azomonas macrocytogenes]
MFAYSSVCRPLTKKSIQSVCISCLLRDGGFSRISTCTRIEATFFGVVMIIQALFFSFLLYWFIFSHRLCKTLLRAGSVLETSHVWEYRLRLVTSRPAFSGTISANIMARLAW